MIKWSKIEAGWVSNAFVSHYSDVMMNAMASHITGVSVVCSTVRPCADQIKHQTSASLTFVRGNHRWWVDSPHKGPVTRKMSPFMTSSVIICTLSVNAEVYICSYGATVYIKFFTELHQSSAILILSERKPPVTGEFPSQMVTNAESFSMS